MPASILFSVVATEEVFLDDGRRGRTVLFLREIVPGSATLATQACVVEQSRGFETGVKVFLLKIDDRREASLGIFFLPGFP